MLLKNLLSSLDRSRWSYRRRKTSKNSKKISENFWVQKISEKKKIHKFQKIRKRRVLRKCLPFFYRYPKFSKNFGVISINFRELELGFLKKKILAILQKYYKKNLKNCKKWVSQKNFPYFFEMFQNLQKFFT